MNKNVVFRYVSLSGTFSKLANCVVTKTHLPFALSNAKDFKYFATRVKLNGFKPMVNNRPTKFSGLVPMLLSGLFTLALAVFPYLLDLHLVTSHCL